MFQNQQLYVNPFTMNLAKERRMNLEQLQISMNVLLGTKISSVLLQSTYWLILITLYTSTVAATPGQFSSPYKVYHSVQLGSVYTKRQHQRCDNSAMTLAILKTMESLENGLQPHSLATPLFSMKTESLASLQSCRDIDADAWCK